MPELVKQKYRKLAVDEIRPHPDNPRQGDVGAISESIEAQGFYGAVLVQESTGYILAGSHRWRAAQFAGIKDLPALVLDVDDRTASRILVADNKTSDLASYDVDQLAKLLTEMDADGGLAGTGFDTSELDSMLATVDLPLTGEEDEAPPVPSEPESTVGEVYELGPHRLVCGDATDVAVLEALMQGETAQCLWTDPPYGVGYVEGLASKGKTKHRAIANDALKLEDMRELWSQAWRAAYTVLDPGSAYYVTGPAGNLLMYLMLSLEENGFPQRHMIVWAKDSLVLGRSDYHYQHEPMLAGERDPEEGEADPVLYGWTDGKHQFHGGRKQTTLWQIDRPKRSELHPTMKPVELVERAIANSTQRGQTVLDPFGGSGTTLIAAHRRGRAARLVEADPGYCDVIRQRYESYSRSL